MKPPNVVRDINWFGAITALLFVALIGLEIFDYWYLRIIQRDYIPQVDRATFSHLKRLFTIGILFFYVILHFKHLSRKYPALKPSTHKIIFLNSAVLMALFVLLIGIQLYFFFPARYPYQEYANLSQFENIISGDIQPLTGAEEADNPVRYAILPSSMIDAFASEQETLTEEYGYCLYGSVLGIVDDAAQIQSRAAYVSGVIKLDPITATSQELLSDPCRSVVHASELQYPDASIAGSDQEMRLLGLLHSHPPTGNDHVLRLQPPECSLSKQDIFSFARENAMGRSLVWGVVCSNKKIFFYGTDDISTPIELIRISSF